MKSDFLEDFGAINQAKPAEPEMKPVDPMQGYEAGYKAGWDDAIASAAQEREHISAEFARNLQELSFTFHEARNQVTASLLPFVEALLSKLLPMSSQTALKENVWSVLEPLAQNYNTPRIQLYCSPEDSEVLEDLKGLNSSLDLELVPETTLHSGQVKLKIGDEEGKVDMSDLEAQISDLLGPIFFSHTHLGTSEALHAG